MCFIPFPVPLFLLIHSLQNGSLPTTIHQQNILTYLTFNIAQCPGLMTKMDIHTPENNGPWPSGMYAPDMAWVFTHLQGTCVDVETCFCQVFPGASWVKATYYQHKDAFFGSTFSEIEKCWSLPQSAGSLWANWKSTSTGWKKLAAKNKKSS